MNHASKTAGTAVIIPIDVRAFCVGDSDRTDGSGFSGITLDYSRLEPADSTLGAAIIGDSNGVARDQNFTPLSPLDTGVHLHWNLPRALTQGVVSEDTQEAQFPLVPNRWLVARLVESYYPQQMNRAWIVESDHISTQPSEGLASVTLFTGYDQDPPYRYLGRTVAADYEWSEPEPGPQPSQLKMLTQSDLTAVHAGDPLFASYYPNCRNIFGMRDDCADIALADSLSLTYVVVGWYSRPENDPLYGGMDAQDMLQRFNWQLSGNPGGTFNQSLYMGVVQAVQRKPGRSYVSAPGSSAVSAGIGNCGVEAFSALLAAQAGDSVNRDTLEEILMAYQLGDLSGLYVPQPDRFTDLRDQLHGAGFGHTPAGIVWTLTKGQDTNQATSLDQLPPSLAAALATLNTIQRRYDQHMIATDGLRMQLYLDWYRAAVAKIVYDDNGSADDLNLLNAIRTYTADTIEFLFKQPEGQAITNPVELSIALRQAYTKLLVEAGNQGWKLKQGNAPWYWRPNDPVVVMTGTDTAHRLRNSGLDTVVRCRLAEDLISQLTVGGRVIGDAFTFGIYPPQNCPVPRACWVEAMLLDLKILGMASGLPPKTLAQALQSLLATQQDNATITAHQGVPPDPCAMQQWDGANPWLPLFMWWEASFYPAPGYSGDYQGNPATDDIPPRYVLDNFSLGTDGAMSPQGWTTPGAAKSFSGRSILTPFASQSLVAALQNDPFANDPQDPGLAQDASKVLAYLQGKPFLYQALSGFTDGLLNLNDTPQLAGASTDGDSVQSSINGDHGLFHQVNNMVRGAHRRGAHPLSAFFPVRGGFLEMQLCLVDVYGQRRGVAFTSFNCATDMRSGDSESRQQAYLQPRLAQPARLCFDYLPATLRESSDTLASLVDSPLCGWLVPNHLDDALMVYDEKGVPRGALYSIYDRVEWMGAPGSPYYGLPLSESMAGANAYLAEMAAALQAGTAAQLQTILTCVDRISKSTTGAVRQDPAVATLIGTPIAVVSAVLRLELCGFPAVNQSWEAFKTDYNASRQDRANPISYLQRVDAGIGAVNFEVVLGDMGRYTDGLFGFFTGNMAVQGGDVSPQFDFQDFHTPATGEGLDGVMDSRVLLSPNGKGVAVLMLVDPLSTVHAVSGVLPTQTLSLQHDLVLPFLKDLSVTFPVRPVLSDSGGLDFPLPVKHGYAWSWIQQDGNSWTVTPMADMPSSKAPPTTPQRLYSGWLKLEREDG